MTFQLWAEYSTARPQLLLFLLLFDACENILMFVPNETLKGSQTTTSYSVQIFIVLTMLLSQRTVIDSLVENFKTKLGVIFERP